MNYSDFLFLKLAWQTDFVWLFSHVNSLGSQPADVLLSFTITAFGGHVFQVRKYFQTANFMFFLTNKVKLYEFLSSSQLTGSVQQQIRVHYFGLTCKNRIKTPAD